MRALGATALLFCVWACARSAADPPPPPDYARADAWAAWPGSASGADTVPPGITDTALPKDQKADLFFIHPTTYLSGGANARYDESGLAATQIDQGVLRFQASTFNACCRIYAPHYRQAAIAAFMQDDDAQAQAAFQLAYTDVLHAFDYYLAHENHGRPFIIASHNQARCTPCACCRSVSPASPCTSASWPPMSWATSCLWTSSAPVRPCALRGPDRLCGELEHRKGRCFR